MRSGIKQVAQHAGVSIASVSHVINNTRYVSDEVKRKVYEAMEELDYRPNSSKELAQSGVKYNWPHRASSPIGYL